MSCICEVNGLIVVMQGVAEYASLLGLFSSWSDKSLRKWLKSLTADSVLLERSYKQ